MYQVDSLIIGKGITVSCVLLDSNSDIQSKMALNVNAGLALGLIVCNIIRSRNKVGSRIEKWLDVGTQDSDALGSSFGFNFSFCVHQFPHW